VRAWCSAFDREPGLRGASAMPLDGKCCETCAGLLSNNPCSLDYGACCICMGASLLPSPSPNLNGRG
jgi:hypothetical protein